MISVLMALMLLYTGRVAGQSSSYIGDCSVPVDTLQDKLPVLIINDKQVVPESTSESLSFNKTDKIQVFCLGDKNSMLYSDEQQDNLTCSGGNSFQSSLDPTSAIKFSAVVCKNFVEPTQTLSTVEKSCGLGNSSQLIDTALQAKDINATDLWVYSSCVDEVAISVAWVQHRLGVENKLVQKLNYTTFQQGKFFAGTDVNKQYTQNEQKITFKQLGLEKYINETYYLTRGHLAARADFPLAPAQIASYSFLNVAPQWNSFNGGNWNRLEQNLRQRVVADGIKTNIITGTLGILELTGTSNMTKVYLGSSPKIPVPLWFYKVVHDTFNEKGIVFFGLNNPFVTIEEAKTMSESLCTNICSDPSFSWLKFNESLVAGYSGCCEVDEFLKNVNGLPPLNTLGILFMKEPTYADLPSMAGEVILILFYCLCCIILFMLLCFYLIPPMRRLSKNIMPSRLYNSLTVCGCFTD